MPFDLAERQSYELVDSWPSDNESISSMNLRIAVVLCCDICAKVSGNCSCAKEA